MSDAPKPLEPAALKARMEAGDELVLLDVREAGELEICKLPGITHIPLSELSVRLTEIDPEDEIVVICHHGIRSAHAAAALHDVGFESLWNLSGGIDRWAEDVDPAMARY